VPCEHTYAQVSRAYVALQLRLASFHDTVDYPEGVSTSYRGAPGLVPATGGSSYSLDDVVSGRVNMGDSIRDFVEAEFCTPFLI
jgi:hypothetical protein